MLKNQQKCYDFPILSETEIIRLLNNLGIESTEAIRRPTSTNVRELYVQIFAKLLNVQLEDLFGRFTPTKKDFTYPEINEFSIDYKVFKKLFINLLNIAQFEDFNEKADILDPTRKRVVSVVSSFLNLLRFDNAITKTIDENIVGVNKLKTLYDETKLNHEIAIKQKENQTKKLKLELSQMKEMKKASSQYEEVILKNKKIYNDLLKEKKANKNRLNLANERNLKIKKEYEEKINSFSYLKKQLVQSPEKFKCRLTNLKSEIERLKGVVKDKNDDIQKLIYLDNLWNKTLSKLKGRMNQSKKIYKLYEQLKIVKQQVDVSNEKLDALEKELKKLVENGKTTKTAIDLENKRSENLHLAAEAHQKNSKLVLEQINQDKSSKKILNEKYKIKLEKDLAKINKIKQKKIKREAENDKSIQAMDFEIKKFKSWSDEFFSSLEAPFGDFSRENQWVSEIYETE